MPYIIRFRQCATDFLHGERVQCFNALKYLTALPVIVLSFLQPDHIHVATGDERVWFGENQIFRLWYVPHFASSQKNNAP